MEKGGQHLFQLGPLNVLKNCAILSYMGFFDTLKKIIHIMGEQRVRPKLQDICFTRRFQAFAKAQGVNEADARDVYQHGRAIKHNMMMRKYNGYEVGIWYFKDRLTGQLTITSIWKRVRR